MVRNKLESLFSKSLKASRSLFGMKLHNNTLAHQNTPADYIISWEEKRSSNYMKIDFKESKIKLALIECKQVTCKYEKGRLNFKRLKQMHDLLNFKTLRMKHHDAYFCIAFYDHGWLNSEVYLIPVHKMYEDIEATKRKSFNRDNFKIKYAEYILAFEKGILVLPLSWRK